MLASCRTLRKQAPAGKPSLQACTRDGAAVADPAGEGAPHLADVESELLPEALDEAQVRHEVLEAVAVGVAVLLARRY